MRIRYTLLLLFLDSCRHPSTPSTSEEAPRFLSSFARHRKAYRESIEGENALVLATQPRAALRSTACQFTERWARVYFGPRHIQEQMRSDQYAPGPVQDAHRRLMERLRERYFLLHEYQRYGQRACEASVQSYNISGLPPGLARFRDRLQAHPTAVDEVTPLLDALPR